MLTVVDLARRRMLEGPVDWHRPAWRRSALLGVGTVLAVAAVAGDIDDQAVWTFTDAQVVVVPFVAVTLTWVAVTVRMTATGPARAAAMAYLSPQPLPPSTWRRRIVGLRRSDRRRGRLPAGRRDPRLTGRLALS